MDQTKAVTLANTGTQCSFRTLLVLEPCLVGLFVDGVFVGCLVGIVGCLVGLVVGDPVSVTLSCCGKFISDEN
jgi:hypothetical protein